MTEVHSPRRLQRRRARGWSAPKGSVYVGRPTEWGNPYKIAGRNTQGFTAEEAVRLFEDRIAGDLTYQARARAVLRGKDLICFCPLSQPCHADVLLRIANEP